MKKYRPVYSHNSIINNKLITNANPKELFVTVQGHTTNIDIWVDDPTATPIVISCGKVESINRLNSIHGIKYRVSKPLTSLSFTANMIALACSAAFPTIGSKMTLIKATDIFNDSEAPCNRPETQDAYG